MRADFQQYYGLNIDGMGTEYGLPHAACLCAQLPADSRVVKALMTSEQLEAMEWTFPVRLAAMQLNVLGVIKWLHTQDAQDGVNYPEPLLPPELRGAEPEPPDSEGYKAGLAAIRERIRQSNGGDARCQEQ